MSLKKQQNSDEFKNKYFNKKPIIYYKLPFPPSVNHAYLNRRTCRSDEIRYTKHCAQKPKFGRIKSIQTKKFENEVMSVVAYQNIVIDEPTIMILFLHPKQDNRRRDVSNYVKVMEDALVKGGVIIDDHILFTLPFFVDKTKTPYSEVWLLPVKNFDNVKNFAIQSLNNLLNYENELNFNS